MRQITISFFFLVVFGNTCSYGQVLIFSGNAVMKMSGNQNNPVYLVINNPSPYAITMSTGSTGKIVSESFYNRIRWRIGFSNAGTYSFPLASSSSADYIPVNIGITSAGTGSSAGSGYIDVASYGTGQDNNPLPVGVNSIGYVNPDQPADGSFVYDRFWLINAGNYDTKPSVTILFTYSNNEKTGGLTAENPLLQAQNHDGTQWIPTLMGTDNQVNSTVSGVNLTNSNFHSIYTLVAQGGNYVLPITLLDFSAKWIDDSFTTAELSWSTQSESNTDYFTIERSRNGQFWERLGTVEAAGNSQNILNYSVLDKQPLGGLAYYRLTQYDLDGAHEHFGPKTLSRELNDWIVFPNPAQEELTVVPNEVWASGYRISIYDLTGREIWSMLADASETISIDTRQFTSGLYTITVEEDGELYVKKVVIKN